MAEAHIEGIATYLNEAKRRSEQLTIVQYLNTALERLPHNLLLKNQRLHRQDMIQWTVRMEDERMRDDRRANGNWKYLQILFCANRAKFNVC